MKRFYPYFFLFTLYLLSIQYQLYAHIHFFRLCLCFKLRFFVTFSQACNMRHHIRFLLLSFSRFLLLSFFVHNGIFLISFSIFLLQFFSTRLSYYHLSCFVLCITFTHILILSCSCVLSPLTYASFLFCFHFFFVILRVLFYFTLFRHF